VSLPNSALSADDITASPAWFPLDPAGPGAVRLVRLDEAAYRAASFLDQRILRTSPEQALISAAVLAEAAARLTAGAHYIFHIGHVGSTLVSRLVGESQSFFSVREPPMLREMALKPAQERAGGPVDLRGTLALLGRTWRPSQRAVLKATSFVSEIAAPVLDADSSSAAIFMFSPALAYLRCILGGPNSRLEAKALAASRLARVRRRLQGAARQIDPRSEGEWIAMSWLCEMVCLQQAAARFNSRILWVDFDAFLAAPQAALASIFRTLRVDATPGEIAGIVSGPIMRQYSKAPEHAYDAALRGEVLAAADSEHGAEIRRGMDWLAQLAARHPPIGALLASPKASH
jgi:hypothetical protein